MDGPQLVARQLALRGTLQRSDLEEILRGVPEALQRRDACEKLFVETEPGIVRGHAEARLIALVEDAAQQNSVFDIQAADRELRVCWRQLTMGTRKMPIKRLEGGGLFRATRLGAGGKAALLAAIELEGGVEAIEAVRDYPLAQQHVVELLREGKLVVRGNALLSRDAAACIC